jgi:hypothetical protein
MLTFRKLEHKIVGSINGKPFNVARTKDTEVALETMAADDRITTKEVLDYIKSCRDQEVAGSNKYLVFKPITGEYFLTLEGFRSKQPLPEVLVKFIQESFDKDTDFMPIVKAWARLLANPRYNAKMGELFAKNLEATYVDSDLVTELMTDEGGGYSREAAVEMATYQDKAITQEGMVATYKVADIVTWEFIMEQDEDSKEWVKKRNPLFKTLPPVVDPTTGEVTTPEKMVKPDYLEDFLFTPAIWTNGDKFYSGKKLGYVYQVGRMQRLPKNALRNLNNTGGGGGLYTGGLQYISCYRSSASHVLTCFINPSDILSFQSEGLAIRVDALFPNNVWDEDESSLKSIYHSSDYAKLSETRLEDLISEALAGNMVIIEEQQAINIARAEGEELKPDVEVTAEDE